MTESDDAQPKTASSHTETSLQLISQELLTEVFQSFAENQCLTDESPKALRSIASWDDFRVKLSFLETCLVPKGRFPSASAEKATGNFHQAMLKQLHPLMDAFSVSPGDTFLFCLEVFEKLTLQSYSNKEEAPLVFKSVTSEEKDILHYIGGSIINSLRNHLSAKRDQEGPEAVVDSLATKTAPKEASHVSMTSLFDRGGLTYIKPGLERCMVEMEIQVGALGHSRRISD